MKTTKYLRIVALIAFALLSLKATAQFLVVFENQNKVISIAEKGVHIAEDKNYAFTIDDALSGKIPFVESKNHTLNFGNTVSRHWIHFKVQNPTNTSLFVKFLNSEIEDLNIHIIKNGVVSKKYVSGLNKVYNSRSISANTITLPLDTASQFEVYIYANSPSAFWCPIEMGTINAIVDDNHFDDIFNGAFIGIMVIMFLYNFLVCILLQDRVYLIYCLYMLAGFAFVFANKGFHLDLLWRNHYTWPNIAPYLAITVNATGLWFSYAFLKVKRYLPSAVKFYLAILVALAFALVINILHHLVLGNVILQVVSTANSALLISCGIIIYNRGQKQALYYIIAWSVLVTGATIYSMMLIGLLPVNSFTQKSFQVALVVEACLLSLALANRINIFRKEAVLAQIKVADIAL